MFAKISKGDLRNVILFKYIFQLLIAPIIASFIMDILVILLEGFIYGFDECFSLFHEVAWGMPAWITLLLCWYLINLTNILSVVPFFKLIADSLSKDNVQTSEIEFTKIMPMYELQCIRQSKRFMCDTFSRKKNEEAFIYDQNNKKYRFFWNEKYGSIEELKKLASAKTLKISYFKHSRIIFDCQIISEADPFGDMSNKE